MTLPLVERNNAKPEAQDLLLGVEKAFGFTPNLMKVFASSPATLKAYLTLSEIFSKSTLTPTEQQLALLAVSFENACTYCVAAHSMIAKKMAGVDSLDLNALREGKSLPNKKHDSLVRFTKELVKKRGNVSDSDIADFKSAGYGDEQVLELILAASFKTLSNYANHIAKTPIDSAFAEYKWCSVEKNPLNSCHCSK